MPKRTEDYSRSVVYCLLYDDEIFYIGSTSDPKKRSYTHKDACESYLLGKMSRYSQLYEYIKDIGGWQKIKMEIMENVNAKDKEDLEKYERYWIEESNPRCNTNIPTRKWQERREESREHYTEYMKEYAQRPDVKAKPKTRDEDRRREWQKTKITCGECGRDVNHSSLSIHKSGGACALYQKKQEMKWITKDGDKWRVRVGKKGNTKSLGTFDDLQKAKDERDNYLARV